MSILITGGSGQTGTRLVAKLSAAGHSVLAASRSGTAPAPLDASRGVKFDWSDRSTHENPFKADSNIASVYLIVPRVGDMLAEMKPFLDLAVEKGVKRFVLLSASAILKGGPAHGKVHEYLDGLKGIEFISLRPSWFFENFQALLAHSIRENDEIATATQEGKVPFNAVDDVVDAAFDALTAEKLASTEIAIFGPDLYNYDEVAEIFTRVLGRNITHRKITTQESVARWKAAGLPEPTAHMLAGLDTLVAQGVEEKIVEFPHQYVGKRHLADWLEANKASWLKA